MGTHSTLLFVNTFIARYYPVCYAFKRTDLNHRALQCYHDRLDIVLTVRIRKMNPRTNAWSETIEILDE